MPEPADAPSALAADVAVIGCGPAGLAAAVTAADAGCATVVLDLGDRPGGQYWRHPDPALTEGPAVTHHGWAAFQALRRRFEGHCRAGTVTYLPGHAVYRIEPGPPFLVEAVAGERRPAGRDVSAACVVLATGAHDRHVPFPGWTLPGVMAVGGAQALLKGSRVAPGRRAVVAGTGPFLLSVAEGLLAAGVEVAAVVEANDPTGYLHHPVAVAAVPAKAAEGAGYAARLARHRVRYLPRHAVVAAAGTDGLSTVTVAPVDGDWRQRPGRVRTLACDLLAVGYGFTPQVDLALLLDCETSLDATGSLVVAVDAAQRTSVPGVLAAGEPTGVGGADLAAAEGALAGVEAARAAGRTAPVAPRRLAQLTRRRDRLRRFAAVLASVHPVRDGWIDRVEPDTLVCRCEEVPAGSVAAAVSLGAIDARAVKLLGRPGMGWCQGRICGPATAALTAHHLGRPVSAADLTALARRPLAQPVPLGILAARDSSSPPTTPRPETRRAP